jgi:hypothetical protein
MPANADRQERRRNHHTETSCQTAVRPPKRYIQADTIETTYLRSITEPQRDRLSKLPLAGAIPNGIANGTALIGPDTLITFEIPKPVNLFAWQDKIFNAVKGALANCITICGPDAILAKVYDGESWASQRDDQMKRLATDSTIAGFWARVYWTSS